jgi:hypothetical protein
MPKTKKAQKHSLRPYIVRASSVAAVLLFIVVSFLAIGLLKTKEVAFETAAPLTPVPDEVALNVFPIGVDPLEELIVENPLVDNYFQKHITVRPKKTPRDGWFHQVLAMLTQYDWYQNLASPISRILVVDSGERKEEVLRNFSQILKWTKEEELTFATLVAGSSPVLPEGKFTPGHYVVNKDASPEEVAHLLLEQFDAQVLSRYPEELQEVVPLQDALTLASILEREAYDFEDMRYIAGVVWNRLFIGMDLQIDATLQYAKAKQRGGRLLSLRTSTSIPHTTHTKTRACHHRQLPTLQPKRSLLHSILKRLTASSISMMLKVDSTATLPTKDTLPNSRSTTAKADKKTVLKDRLFICRYVSIQELKRVLPQRRQGTVCDHACFVS